MLLIRVYIHGYVLQNTQIEHKVTNYSHGHLLQGHSSHYNMSCGHRCSQVDSNCTGYNSKPVIMTGNNDR